MHLTLLDIAFVHPPTPAFALTPVQLKGRAVVTGLQLKGSPDAAERIVGTVAPAQQLDGKVVPAAPPPPASTLVAAARSSASKSALACGVAIQLAKPGCSSEGLPLLSCVRYPADIEKLGRRAPAASKA